VKFILVIILLAVAWLGEAWGLMLTTGIAHRDWWPFVPLMGYHVALALTVPLVLLSTISAVAKGLIEAAK
jgi:hypothetical protein